MQERGIRYCNKKRHSSDALVTVCSSESIVDDFLEMTPVCETSEVNVKIIYDRDQNYS